ncbi:protein cereblon homolog [Limulus polyphemus]|uniref:Protein cereblon homolog n=1 Tax=Limulus polyphemus TaxID=6850 RepID=A0ABM1BSI9_LIMPO|nr:protein cereblon homolog [Limulus polyphemus]
MFGRQHVYSYYFFTFLLKFFTENVDTVEFYDDYLLCRQCGHDITEASHLKSIASRIALHQRNDTILGVRGVLLQLFRNPAGKEFELVTVSKADVIGVTGWYEDHTWFPGYSWKIGICPRCGQHVGWLFQEIDKEDDSAIDFIGLIMEKLIHQSYADSLITGPRSLRSR